MIKMPITSIINSLTFLQKIPIDIKVENDHLWQEMMKSDEELFIYENEQTLTCHPNWHHQYLPCQSLVSQSSHLPSCYLRRHRPLPICSLPPQYHPPSPIWMGQTRRLWPVPWASWEHRLNLLHLLLGGEIANKIDSNRVDIQQSIFFTIDFRWHPSRKLSFQKRWNAFLFTRRDAGVDGAGTENFRYSFFTHTYNTIYTHRDSSITWSHAYTNITHTGNVEQRRKQKILD